MASRPRIALITTEYRPRSHADVIGTRFLEGYELDGEQRQPRTKVVSLYTDQVPENDMSREMAARHGVPIVSTVRQALTLGWPRLAVDAAIIIGEHGQYPMTSWGQKMYPRRRLFSSVIEVFEELGEAVPVFSDKHLAYAWEDARWMAATARRLGFVFQAGSVLPHTWRRPPLELPQGVRLERAVSIGYGGLESYGFHALETLQCMVERRRGGERGIRQVRCVSGEAFWQRWQDGAYDRELARAAVETLKETTEGSFAEHRQRFAAFELAYVDGLEATVFMLPGHVRGFAFACRYEGGEQIEATQFYLDPTVHNHFSFQVQALEEMVLEKRAQWPLERTLLTTGALHFLLRSHHEGGTWVETPELSHITYSPE